MESQVLILFCTLLSLFLFFSLASAIWMGLRRHGRLSGWIWGVLFLLPAIPFSPLAQVLLSPLSAPVQLMMTVDATGNRVLSLLPTQETEPLPDARLTFSETGVIQLVKDASPPAAAPDFDTLLPKGVTIPGWLWDICIFSLAFLLFLWTMVALAHVIHRVCVYVGNIHFLTSRSTVCRDERLEAVFAHAVSQVKLWRKPVLRVVEEGIALSPCTAGFLTPTVYISHRQATLPSDSLEYIFLHELCHVKRHDFLIKLLALLATSLYSFSPFAGPVRRQVYEDCELGCDRAVLAFIGQNRRERYLETILTIAEETLVRRPTDTQVNVNGELFSFAVARSAKELLLRRFKSLRQEELPLSRKVRFGRGIAVALFCLSHVGIFAVTDTSPMADPLVNLENIWLETVVREYYDLPAAEPIHLSHLNGIYSLEITLSRKLDRDNPLLTEEDALALCCLVNEGKYPVKRFPGGETGGMLERFGLQDWLADGISPVYRELAEEQIPIPHPLTEPLWMDRSYSCAIDLLPDVCPLTTLERYLPTDEALCERLLQHYICLDGTEEALDAYTTMLYKAVIATYKLSADDGEEEITEAFVRYCGERGIVLDGDRGDMLTQLYEYRQEEILGISPAALCRPMVFLDPALAEETVEELTSLLLAEGITTGKLVPMEADATGRYGLDLADLVLFAGLRTVVLDDRLTMEEDVYDALTGRRCSVVEK